MKKPIRSSVRGLRVRQFCEREGISRRTAWRWVEKGIVSVSRVAPLTGVRIAYQDAPPRRES